MESAQPLSQKNSDPVSAGKFAAGLIRPQTHLKFFALACVALFWGFVIWAVYVAYFQKKPQTQTNFVQPGGQAVQAQAGSAAVMAQAGSTVKIESKRRFEPFAEIFTELNTSKDWRSGIRVGIRL